MIVVYGLIVISFIAYCFYTVVCRMISPAKQDFRLIRRTYYLFVILQIAVFAFFFNDQIKTLSIIKVSFIDETVLNYAVIIVLWFLAAFIWESLFISCRSIKTLKFKDIEFSLSELLTVEYSDKLREKEIKNLYQVLKAKLAMVKFIDDYIEKTIDLDPEVAYRHVITHYSTFRGNIKLFVRKETMEGLEELKQKLNFKSDQMTSVIYTINNSAIQSCLIPAAQSSDNKDCIVMRIKTEFSNENIFVGMKGQGLIANEDFVIADIVHYFELAVSNDILATELFEINNSIQDP